MRKLDKLVESTALILIALSASSTLYAAQNDDQERCYGIVKAGKNDCNTATASCAGSSTKDNQADAYIFLPKGTCEKIVGGQLKSSEPQKKG